MWTKEEVANDRLLGAFLVASVLVVSHGVGLCARLPLRVPLLLERPTRRSVAAPRHHGPVRPPTLPSAPRHATPGAHVASRSAALGWPPSAGNSQPRREVEGAGLPSGAVGASAHRLVGNHAVEDAPALTAGSDVSGFAQVAENQGDPALARARAGRPSRVPAVLAPFRSRGGADRGSSAATNRPRKAVPLASCTPARTCRTIQEVLYTEQSDVFWRGF